jgi:hypothetical protein
MIRTMEKSPGKAWATLSKVSDANISSGDAVLFERDGLWRGSLIAKEGVSYSAYGEGEKPKIYGSLQNYSIKEKWLESETPNVYVYNQVFGNDAGLLVFNNGEAHSYKKVIGIDGFSGTIGELKNDLEMYHNMNDKKIYLYSDKGNPADRYSSIEFCLNDMIIKIGGANVLIDNLCIKYGGAHGIRNNVGLIGSLFTNGLKVTNCEIGWIGGSILKDATRYGNAIEIWGGCKDYYVDHCYIYQIYDAGVTHQYKNPTSTEMKIMENVTYSNNLIENCTYSIEYFLNQPSSGNDLMKNILFKNNICRYSGYGWGDQRPKKDTQAHVKSWPNPNPAENFIIENNIFDRGKYMMVHISATEATSLPVMKNNIYLQNSGKDFGIFAVNINRTVPPNSLLSFNSSIGELLKQRGIEKNPSIIIID